MNIEDFLNEYDSNLTLDTEMMNMLEKAENFNNLLVIKNNSLMNSIIAGIKNTFSCH